MLSVIDLHAAGELLLCTIITRCGRFPAVITNSPDPDPDPDIQASLQGW